MLVKIVDGAPVDYSIRQLRRDNPQVSFPAEIGAEQLAEFGVYEADIADAPPTQFHVATRRLAIISDGKALVSREWDLPALADVKAAAISELSSIRDRKIEAGFDFGGVTVPCDDKSLARYTGARLYAIDHPETVRKWKLPSGFVELDADAIKALAKAAADYVQACFDEQAEQVAQIDAATDAEGVEAVLVLARG